MIYWIAKLLLILICRPYFRVQRKGIKYVPQRGGSLFISNHASYLDPPLIGMCSPRRVHFMAKAELFKIPIFSWLIRRLGAIPVRRGALDRKGLTTCRNLLKEGRALLIFPEGTRTQNGEMGEVKPGAALLVADLPDVSIVPVYVKGSFRAMPRGKWFPRPVRVAIRFGAPFKIPQKEVEMDKKKYYQNICFQLLNAIKALKNNARIDPEDHHL